MGVSLPAEERLRELSERLDEEAAWAIVALGVGAIKP